MFWKLGTSGEPTGSVSHILITSWGFIPHNESLSSSLCVLGCSIVSDSANPEPFKIFSAIFCPYVAMLQLKTLSVGLQPHSSDMLPLCEGSFIWMHFMANPVICLRQGLWTTLRHANMWCPRQFPTPAIYFRWVELMTFQSSLIDGY